MINCVLTYDYAAPEMHYFRNTRGSIKLLGLLLTMNPTQRPDREPYAIAPTLAASRTLWLLHHFQEGVQL